MHGRLNLSFRHSETFHPLSGFGHLHPLLTEWVKKKGFKGKEKEEEEEAFRHFLLLDRERLLILEDAPQTSLREYVIGYTH